MRHRDDGHADADHPGDLGGEHAPGVDDDLALDVALVGADLGHPTLQPFAVVSMPMTRVLVRTATPAWRARAASA